MMVMEGLEFVDCSSFICKRGRTDCDQKRFECVSTVKILSIYIVQRPRIHDPFHSHPFQGHKTRDFVLQLVHELNLPSD